MLQGEIWWARFSGSGSEPKGRRPALIVQSDDFNRSGMATTIVAAVTTSPRAGGYPGNVRLHKGEANLERPSIVNVTQIGVIDKSRLEKQIGTLSAERLHEVLSGIALVFGFI